ncbi:MAG: hypothetical protein JWO30_2314 [Fibrobacteres bacterium]|nr:hypothetical protein [Fibrobacterota bacterium]
MDHQSVSKLLILISLFSALAESKTPLSFTILHHSGDNNGKREPRPPAMMEPPNQICDKIEDKYVCSEISKHPLEIQNKYLESKNEELTTQLSELQKESDENRKLWISESVNLDLFVRDERTNEVKAGLSPGLGYGIRYCPTWWKNLGKTKSFIDLDFYAQAVMVNINGGNKFVDVNFLPAVTFVDWISIGIGWRGLYATENGDKDLHSVLTSFGIRKPL